MTDAGTLAGRQPQSSDLPDPSAQAPQGTLHVRFSMTEENGVFTFEAEEKNHPDEQWGKVVDDILKEKLVDPPMGPWDFRIRRNCWVVLELHKGNWQFHRDRKGVTLKNAEHEVHYSGWRHAFSSKEAPESKPGKDGCRIVVFQAKRNHKAEDHGFNLHTQFTVGGGRYIVVDFDPDIKNHGDG